ncbi:hypothetical protein BZA70DRAFT_304827 [Myxozyma melibiosi]|uniref:Uncharacterized protein n=1 Tax=Myxozyma melibiosi TaxID=54550 RepID=A0ABR1F5S2_9ASCO
MLIFWRCFKDERHVHDAVKRDDTKPTTPATPDKPAPSSPATTVAPSPSSSTLDPRTQTFSTLLSDPTLQHMLASKSLQHHLVIINQFLTDPQFAGEHTAEGRRAVALKKLRELRAGGVESNSEVEEFVVYVLEMMEKGGV